MSALDSLGSAPSSPSVSRLEPHLTGKAKQLAQMQANDMSEAEKLREEVNRTRALRASRLSSRNGSMSASGPPSPAPAQVPGLAPQSPAATPTEGQGRISTTSSSFPVFAGRINATAASGSGGGSGSGGTSLANFIGGDTRVKGPLLNKVRKEDYDGYGLETDAVERPTATFLSRLNESASGKDGAARPGHFGKNRVAMPGMVRPGASGAQTPEPYTQTRSESLGVDMQGPALRPASSAGSLPTRSTTDPGPPADKKDQVNPAPEEASASDAANSQEHTSASSRPPIAAKKPSYSKPSSSSASSKPASSAPAPSAASSSPQAASITKSSPAPIGGAASRFSEFGSSSEPMGKQPTPSLTRLKGSNLVKQRLAWGEQQGAASPPSASASGSPATSPSVSANSSSRLPGVFSPPLSSASPRFGSSAPTPAPPTVDAATEKEASPAGTPRASAAKRSSVLDRWNLDRPDEQTASSSRSHSQKSSPSASPARASLPTSPPATTSASAATAASYKFEYGVRSSGAGSSAYKSDYGVKATPGDGNAKSGDKDASPSAAGARASPAGDAQYKSSYGVVSRPAVSRGFSATKGSGTSGQERERDEPVFEESTAPAEERAAARRATSAASPSLPTLSIDVDTREDDPSSTQPMTKSPASGTSPFNRPTKPPTWSKPSYASPSARSPLASPNSPRSAEEQRTSSGGLKTRSGAGHALSLPISVSPVPYSPSSASPDAGASGGSAPSSPRAGSFRPSSTSFPVSLGIAPTHARPTSLAHFMGADRRVQGPVLNKVRQEGLHEGVDMGDDTGSAAGKGVGSFLSRNPGLLEEARRKKGGVALPGMVARNSNKPDLPATNMPDSESPAAAPTDEQIQKALTPTLPLPGAASPKLPYPGQFSPPSAGIMQQLSLQDDNTHDDGPDQAQREQGSASLPYSGTHTAAQAGSADPTSSLSSTSSPSAAAPRLDIALDNDHDNHDKNEQNEQNSFAGQNSKKGGDDDPTMSRLLRSGYSTQRSFESVSPSQHAQSEFERPTAMDVSHEFRKQCVSPALPEQDNPWAQSTVKPTGGASTSPDDSKRSSIAVDKRDWQDTLKSFGGKPARHAPRPPVLAQDSYSSPAAPPISIKSPPPVVNSTPIRDRFDVPQEYLHELERGNKAADLSVFSSRKTSSSATYVRYLSVDILSIAGSSATPLAIAQAATFYSSELLAIVLRSKTGGLVTSDLIIWRGRHALAASRDGNGPEERKVAELEGRYRTQAREVVQGCETEELVRALGGRLVIRHGSREAFDLLNTTLYRVQAPSKGIVIIDEVDLQRSSLTSSSSFVASVFQDLFVWHGVGAADAERVAATEYANELARGDSERSITEFEEGHEEVLWSEMMGDDEYASANHWRFRRSHGGDALAIYAVNGGNALYLGDHTLSSLPKDAVQIIELPFELFVLVPPAARGKRADIATALRAAEARSASLAQAGDKPFRPPVHALVLPSVIPLDLTCCFRSTVLTDLNSPYAPVTMNVVDAQTGLEQLQALSFSLEKVEDMDLLPLGVSPEMVIKQRAQQV